MLWITASVDSGLRCFGGTVFLSLFAKIQPWLIGYDSVVAIIVSPEVLRGSQWRSIDWR